MVRIWWPWWFFALWILALPFVAIGWVAFIVAVAVLIVFAPALTHRYRGSHRAR